MTLDSNSHPPTQLSCWTEETIKRSKVRSRTNLSTRRLNCNYWSDGLVIFSFTVGWMTAEYSIKTPHRVVVVIVAVGSFVWLLPFRSFIMYMFTCADDAALLYTLLND